MEAESINKVGYQYSCLIGHLYMPIKLIKLIDWFNKPI